MWHILIFLMISAFITLGITGCFKKASKNSGNNSDNHYTGFDTIKGPVTKAEIKKRLKELSESKAPETLNPGAMCYEIAAAPKRVEYVCPKCGEKTLYSVENAYKLSNIETCRNAINNIYNLEISLDESQFCKHCSPGVEDPVLCISILYSGESVPKKVCDISPADITLINEFLCGSNVHRTFNESEEPLKDYIGRLQTLFDINEK